MPGAAARAVKAAGGGTHGACAVLLREVAALRRRLADASIDVGAVLRPGRCRRRRAGRRLRRRTHPAAATAAALGTKRALAVAHGGGGGVGPCAGRRHLARHVLGGGVAPHRRRAPTSSGPLLLSSEVRRTMSVVMEPLGPIEASRKVEQARTADIADAELRRRGGFLATARRRREEEILVRREVELADGHAQYRFSGYVTVSAARPRRARGGLRTRRAGGRTGRARAAAVLRGPGQHLPVHAAARPRPVLTPVRCMGIPAHQATTRHLGAALPVSVASPGSTSGAGVAGAVVLVGRDLLGGDLRLRPLRALPARACSPTPTWS